MPHMGSPLLPVEGFRESSKQQLEQLDHVSSSNTTQLRIEKNNNQNETTAYQTCQLEHRQVPPSMHFFNKNGTKPG